VEKKSILLVDDEMYFRASLRDVLENEGFHVVEAENGIEAKKLLEDMVFDIVITDILMPEMDGLELLVGLRSRNLPTRVITMSGGGRLGAELYLRLSGIHDAVHTSLTKPFTIEQMLGAISRAMAAGNGNA